MRRGYFLLTLMLCIATSAFAQKLDADYYVYPLRDVAGYYSANFGEMRPNHFHSGTDFKTDGVEGKSVVAVADGYVSRVLYSPSGYGLALYVAHPNGTISVYGHLSRFRKDIAEFVFAERHRQQRSRIDVECKPDQFIVKQGEEIAKSGNTGSSMGPHLHFEIRDAGTHKTFNIIAQGVIKPKDKISPYIMKLHYFEVDSVRGVPVHSKPTTYAIYKSADNTYRTKQTTPIKVGRKGYFVVECSDRKDDCANTYGVYNLKAEVDGKRYFEYRNDGFTFDLSRYCNAISWYPQQRKSRNEVMRMARLQGCPTTFYPTMVGNGVITTQPAQTREMKITATDDCGNSSTLEFQIKGKAYEECFRAELAEDATIAEYNHDFAHKIDDTVSVIIPRGALYESIALNLQPSSIEPKSESVKILSPAYTIHNGDTPLHKSIGVVFTQKVAEELQPYTTMASVDSGGNVYHAGGKYRHNRLAGRTTSFGTFCLVADTTPPVVTPQFESGADCRSKSRIALRLGDNFSGIASYNVWIDDKWVAVDYSRSKVWIDLRAEGITGGKKHSIKVVVKDSCGNKTVWEGNFIR
ncbi:MAG: M23 family metallopeptidase [Alistipes sp.]|nr:M23 family metallopeptidase [Alistipes sp.]